MNSSEESSDDSDVPLDPTGNLGSWVKENALGLWDVENCPIPTGHSADIFLKALEAYLKSLGFDCKLQVLAVAGDITDPNRVPPKVIETLSPQGVEFESAPKDEHGEVPENAADLVIVEKLKRFGRKRAKVPLIVIAGDGMYTQYLQEMEEEFDVVWLYPDAKTSHETRKALSPTALICYEDLLWTYMQIEHKRSGTTDPAPRRGAFGGNRGKKSEQRRRQRMEAEQKEDGRGKRQMMEEGRGRGWRKGEAEAEERGWWEGEEEEEEEEEEEKEEEEEEDEDE